MKKEIIVILAIIALLLLVNKSKAEKPGIVASSSEDDKTGEPVYTGYGIKVYDTSVYQIKKDDWLSKLAQKIVGSQDRDTLIAMTNVIAEMNGKNPDLFDNVPTPSAFDPDTLYVGEMVKIPSSWEKLA